MIHNSKTHADTAGQPWQESGAAAEVCIQVFPKHQISELCSSSGNLHSAKGRQSGLECGWLHRDSLLRSASLFFFVHRGTALPLWRPDVQQHLMLMACTKPFVLCIACSAACVSMWNWQQSSNWMSCDKYFSIHTYTPTVSLTYRDTCYQ